MMLDRVARQYCKYSLLKEARVLYLVLQTLPGDRTANLAAVIELADNRSEYVI
jgi:hypothetical protein